MTCLAAVASTALSACSSGRPDPRDTAETLAAALSKQDVSEVPVVQGGRVAQPDLERIVKGLGKATVKVTVSDVAEDEDDQNAATATLASRWTLNGATWKYTTRAPLSYVEDAWQVRWSPRPVAPDLTADERLTLRTTPADRGDILGAQDEGLVVERSVKRIGIDKSRITPEQAAGSAAALAQRIGIDPAQYAQRVEAAGPQAFVVGLVVRDGSAEALSEADLAAIPGAVQLAAEIPLAPTRTFGQPMLGVVGEATAEIVQKSKGAVRAGDMVGLSGLALRYDAQLRGTPGVVVEAVSSEAGAKPRELFRGEPKAGKQLRTTIDARLQGAADQILADVKPASAIVAIRPSTGEIVTLASGSGGGGADTAAAATTRPARRSSSSTSLALLRSGLTPSSRVPCTRTITVEGREFTNYSDYPASAVGDIPLRSAIANSCNTAMIAQRDEAPQAKLADAAAALGLGPDVDLGYPAFLGSVPDAAKGTEHAASMIGQGRIEASPLAMAVVAASIANGSRVTPTLLAEAPPSRPPRPAPR